MEVTIEKLTDKQLVERFKKWQEVKALGKALEDEVKARYEEKGKLKGVVKVVFRTTKAWKSVKSLPKKLLVKPLGVSEALKKGLLTEAEVAKLTIEKKSYSYKVEV